MSKWIAGVAGIVVVLFAATVWAQMGNLATKCYIDNKKAHGEVVQFLKEARTAGKISAEDAQAMESRLSAMWKALNKSSLTLRECFNIGDKIAAERTNINKMAPVPKPPAQDPRIAQCRTENLNSYSDLVELFEGARATGGLLPWAIPAFLAMESRINPISQPLNKDGQSLAECQGVTSKIAAERANLLRMVQASAQNSTVAQCRRANLKAYSEVFQIYQDARAAGRMSAPFQAMAWVNISGHLNTMKTTLNKYGLPLTECQDITRQIAAERDKVKQMAAIR